MHKIYRKVVSFLNTDKLLHQLKRMDKSKRDEMLGSLDKSLSDDQKQRLVEMVKSKEIDGLISSLVQSEEVQKKLSDLLGQV